MSQVEVRLFATLQKYTPTAKGSDSFTVEIPTGATVDQLIDCLDAPAEEIKRVFVNHRIVEGNHVLGDGDRVSLFPLVAGG